MTDHGDIDAAKVRSWLVAQIAPNVDDAAIAAQFVDRVLANMLDWSIPTVKPTDVSMVVVYAFGNRVDEHGVVTPGPMNEQLADSVSAFIAEHPVPVYAQWEVADALVARHNVADVRAIRPDRNNDGSVIYLSTAGVAEKATAWARADGIDEARAAVVAWRDHAARCVITSRAAGMTWAAVPEGLALPMEYDALSGQSWTRDRARYLVHDFAGRLLSS